MLWIIVRIVLMGTMTIAIMGSKKFAPHYTQPLTWLYNYVKGTAKDMIVPSSLILEAKSAFERAIYIDAYQTISWKRQYLGRYSVNHSLIYEGRGFANRPKLFYLLGGFTFTTKKVDRSIVVYGKDHYDWTPRQEGGYFWSPLGTNPIIMWVCKMMGNILGSEYIGIQTLEGTEQAGISNQFWSKLLEVGAKEFDTYFECPLWTVEEFEQLLVKLDEEEQECGGHINYNVPAFGHVKVEGLWSFNGHVKQGIMTFQMDYVSTKEGIMRSLSKSLQGSGVELKKIHSFKPLSGYEVNKKEVLCLV